MTANNNNNKWKKHFKDMLEGKIQPGKNGWWRVNDPPPQLPETPPIKVVSNTQQAVDQAKSQTSGKRKRLLALYSQNKRRKARQNAGKNKQKTKRTNQNAGKRKPKTTKHRSTPKTKQSTPRRQSKHIGRTKQF